MSYMDQETGRLKLPDIETIDLVTKQLANATENANQLININNKNYINSVKKFIKSVQNKKIKNFSHEKNTSQLIIKIIKKLI